MDEVEESEWGRVTGRTAAAVRLASVQVVPVALAQAPAQPLNVSPEVAAAVSVTFE